MGDASAREVRWLPDLGDEGPDEGQGPGDESTDLLTLPVFPLGVCYLPFTSHVLNIFEPRYRSMYSDILFNGSRRFVVTMVDQESGKLAETGVVFYLDDLREVSEQTGDAVKYVCSHSVIGRVRIERVLNSDAWFLRSTYLKARVRLLPETGDGPDGEAACAQAEEALRASITKVVELQAELNELPRFTQQMLKSLNVGLAPDASGLWGAVIAWRTLQDQRVLAVQERMQAEVSKRVTDFFRAKGGSAPIPSRVRLEDLPADLRAELVRVQEGYRQQLEELSEEPHGDAFQLVLQARSHAERLALFTETVDREAVRLGRRASLKKLFDQS